MKIVILAGGGGSRLFPLSRTCYPKQFLHIAGEKSFLAQTIERYRKLVDAKDILIVTNDQYYFQVQAELSSIGAEDAHIIMEPVGRNTAPAIALAMEYCKEKLGSTKDDIIFISPSDHVIRPVDAFCQVIKESERVAVKGFIVTLGITPTKPETGYGYIEAGEGLV
ncbi:MAG TPA: sugar phosphate nucleotidyltransferase [Veillonellaceae bacterium]|nr:sugar phosphate nucleotidyltransferase [Veillonellaceae bacterium]